MFDLANISISVIIFLLRFAVVFLLYLFLWQVVRVVTRDLQVRTTVGSLPPSRYGYLVVSSSSQPGVPVGKSFPLSPTTIIGRSTDAHISLNDTFLSSEHARLILQGDVWSLEDLSSTNGTFLNGLEVRAATELHSGDVVRVGRIELKLA
ncbi:FHA domain-containing protein [Candidatus Chloroploca sp. M-50]|uniref:FHA domain-containing protein n=1 Tax=Candidatus Chloroploca mongolica TaxID=2528176 RepID=A0ABS4DCG6_9CHLR|nr:FHA domain-containing protein [Candidatus Chloroploca mongolica]MBP1467134.1 FHA domain-containing protein [Candidatus Chloroploca mongolica]